MGRAEQGFAQAGCWRRQLLSETATSYLSPPRREVSTKDPAKSIPRQRSSDAALGHNLIVEGWPTTHLENTTSGNYGAYTGQIRSLKLQRTIIEEMRLFEVLRPPRKGTLRRSSTLLRSSRPPPLKSPLN
jgi:hypothetical protein